MLTTIWDFLFHRHEWELVEKGDLYCKNSLYGNYQILRCKKCFKLKQQKVTV